MAKTNKRKNKRFGKKGKGKTSRFFKELFNIKDAYISPESENILDKQADMLSKVKPYPKKEKFTRGKVIASALGFNNDEYSGPKYGPNNSNSSISTLDEEPSAKINFNSEYYDSRNGSPTTVDENEINIGFGGKRKTKKRKYKKI